MTQQPDIRYTEGDLFLSVGGLYVRTGVEGDARETPVAELLPIRGEGLESIEAVGRRFIATWNACSRIPDRALLPGAFAETREALAEMVKVVECLMQLDAGSAGPIPFPTRLRAWIEGTLKLARELTSATGESDEIFSRPGLPPALPPHLSPFLLDR